MEIENLKEKDEVQSLEDETVENDSIGKIVFKNRIMKVVDNGNELLHYYTMFSPKLEMWYRDAYLEHGIHKRGINMDYALFPRKWFHRVNQFPRIKIYDYCFLGSFKIDKVTKECRKWIVPFIKNKFTRNSYLLFTDHKTKKNYKQSGNYDFTLKRKGFVPKEVRKEKRNFFDRNYYEKMCQSKFVLCPAGDLYWSMRFYEALMCKTIPIVKSVDETFRSYEESLLGYKYYLTTDEHIYREDWTEHNYQLFLKHHLLHKGNIEKDHINQNEESVVVSTNIETNSNTDTVIEKKSEIPLFKPVVQKRNVPPNLQKRLQKLMKMRNILLRKNIL